MKKKYFWLLIGGIIALLIGMLLKLNVLPLNTFKDIPILEIVFTAFVEGIIALGSGLIVAFFSTKIKISDKISEMLRKSGKEKIIDELLPTKGKLSNYLHLKIKHFLSFDEEYRTNTVYKVNAMIQDDKVIVETILTYTMYFDSKKSPIVKMCFDTESSVAEYIKFSNPDNSNDNITIEKEKLSFKKTGAHGDGLIYEYSCLIPKKYRKCEYINIEKKYTFSGEDHWINFGIIFQHLTQGLDFSLTLSDELKINEITIFEDQNIFSKKQTDNLLSITTTQWLSRYGGFSVLIAKRQ